MSKSIILRDPSEPRVRHGYTAEGYVPSPYHGLKSSADYKADASERRDRNVMTRHVR